MKTVVVTLTLFLPLVWSLLLQEDDLVFDDGAEETSQVPGVQSKDEKAQETPHPSLERFRGIPNNVAVVGHVFKMKIPKQAFGGSIDHYELHGSHKAQLLSWAYFDEKTSSFFGVPSKQDLGQHYIVIEAYGTYGDVTRDIFTIQVNLEDSGTMKHREKKTHCADLDEQTFMNIILDTKLDDLKPITRVKAIRNLARYLGMNNSLMSMQPGTDGEKGTIEDLTVVLTGPGNIKRRRAKYSTVIKWQMNCASLLWKDHETLLKKIKQEARDGTLAEVLQLPVLLWRVTSETSDLLRNRRETGSGDYGNTNDNDADYEDNYDYDESYDNGDGDGADDNELLTELPPKSFVPSAVGESEPKHPHRHHHGEETIDWTGEKHIDEHNIVPVVDHKLESQTNSIASSHLQPRVELTENSSTLTPMTTMNAITSSILPPTVQVPPIETSSMTTIVDTEISTRSSIFTTTALTISRLTIIPTIIEGTEKNTTAKVEYGVRNHPPKQDKRLKKIPVTAGKPLSYVIPANTFSDIEDGDTRSLRLSLKLKGSPVKSTHWLQFNSETQEIYGLPLEEDVSVWDYDLVASDRDGLEVSDKLDIYVQQHKLSRSINHEFSIYLKIEKRSEFSTNVDWELKVVQRLAQLYGDSDPSHITVRSIDIDDNQAIFTWTNDSIPRSNECPRDAISKLLHILIANTKQDPSAMLQEALGPEMKVKKVVARGIGQCENMNQPEPASVPSQEPKINFPPLPRNQVDHINATVGQLLVFKVPEDTFYDPEDGSARNMKMSLLTVDRTPIPTQEWLQFDQKNQEFYGVPMNEDIRRKEYQLVITDREGASATDGLVVVVHPPADTEPSAEFTIKLGTNYDEFVHSAVQKKNFIQKLRDLFGDKNTNAISLTSISPVGKNTVITWRNTTLPTAYCPNKEITMLSEVLFVRGDNKGLRNRIESIMGSEFPVDQLTLTPMGICQGEFTRVHSHDRAVPPSEDSKSIGATHDDYLITFVLPAIIIAAMLVLAGIIACLLYKRKRRGKMSVNKHDDERQSFRSKGIPVIFQDELEEKPDPGNKSPVILKEEKPPLPPPEYQKADDGADQPMLSKENSEEPYQPPPPFARTTDNNRQNRPKPTPTYRKPPPYVPP